MGTWALEGISKSTQTNEKKVTRNIMQEHVGLIR